MSPHAFIIRQKKTIKRCALKTEKRRWRKRGPAGEDNDGDEDD